VRDAAFARVVVFVIAAVKLGLARGSGIGRFTLSSPVHLILGYNLLHLSPLSIVVLFPDGIWRCR